jgi:hypothetical protein
LLIWSDMICTSKKITNTHAFKEQGLGLMGPYHQNQFLCLAILIVLRRLVTLDSYFLQMFNP